MRWLPRAMLFYLLIYTLMNIGAFAVVISVAHQGEDRLQIEDYAGFGWQQPLLGVFLTVFLLSLAGFPGTGGFIGKIFLLQGAMEADLWTLAVVLVMATLVSYWYYLRVAWYMWMREAPEPDAHAAVLAPFPCEWPCCLPSADPLPGDLPRGGHGIRPDQRGLTHERERVSAGDGALGVHRWGIDRLNRLWNLSGPVRFSPQADPRSSVSPDRAALSACLERFPGQGLEFPGDVTRPGPMREPPAKVVQARGLLGAASSGLPRLGPLVFQAAMSSSRGPSSEPPDQVVGRSMSLPGPSPVLN